MSYNTLMLGRKIIFMIMIALLAMAAGCSNQSRRPTQDVLMTQQALRLTEHLRSAYAVRDLAGLESMSSTEAYAEIVDGIKDFKFTAVEFNPGWMDILEDNTMRLRIEWAGKWVMASGAEVKESGNAVFVLGGAPMMLLKIEGRSPFAEPAGGAMGTAP